MTSVDRSSVSLVKSQLSDYKAINKSYARQNDSTLISNKNASRELIKSGINLLDPELSSIVIKSSSKLKDRLQIPDGTGRYIPSDYIDESSNLNASFPVRQVHFNKFTFKFWFLRKYNIFKL